MKKLSDEQIKEMISAIVSSLDYDIWKDIFLNEESECSEVIIDEMIDIVKTHIE